MDELIDLNEVVVEEEEQEEIALATITEVGTDGVQIQVDGEEEAGEKEYKVNTAIKFAVGDRVKIFKNSGTYLVEYKFGAPMEDYPIPKGGSDGQVLMKDGADDYAVKWANLPSAHGIPSGGSSGQALIKSSGTDYDASWGDMPHGIPTGGTSGQVLAKNSNSSYDVTWKTIDTHGIPSGGTTGQYLVKSSNSNYDVGWASAPSSDRLKSGTKQVIYNGSALYPDSTASLGASNYYWNGCYFSGAMRFGNNAYNSSIGFFGTTPQSQQRVGSSGTLATLISALQKYGLIS